MNLMLPSARRKDGEKQPCITVGKIDIRIPFVHYEWEIPEMIQACVVFLTGTAATQYLQDLFGFTFEMALSIVFVHELLYMVNNTMGDPLIGGWITPAVPLITTFLLNFEGTDRMYALVGMELILGIMYVVLGITWHRHQDHRHLSPELERRYPNRIWLWPPVAAPTDS